VVYQDLLTAPTDCSPKHLPIRGSGTMRIAVGPTWQSREIKNLLTTAAGRRCNRPVWAAAPVRLHGRPV
jgi:hypothetical protein